MDFTESYKNAEKEKKEADNKYKRELQKQIAHTTREMLDKMKQDKGRDMHSEIDKELRKIIEEKGLRYDLYTLDAMLCGVAFQHAISGGKGEKGEGIEAIGTSCLIMIAEEMREAEAKK